MAYNERRRFEKRRGVDISSPKPTRRTAAIYKQSLLGKIIEFIRRIGINQMIYRDMSDSFLNETVAKRLQMDGDEAPPSDWCGSIDKAMELIAHSNVRLILTNGDEYSWPRTCHTGDWYAEIEDKFDVYFACDTPARAICIAWLEYLDGSRIDRRA